MVNTFCIVYCYFKTVAQITKYKDENMIKQ